MLLKLPLRETSLVSEPVPRNGKFCGRDRGKKPDQIGRRDRASSNQNEKSPPIPGLSDRALNIRKIADWMVEMIWTKLAAPHPIFELVSALESGTEFFEAETAGRNSLIPRVCGGRDRVIQTI